MKLPVLIGLLLCVGALAQVDTTGPENETTPGFTVETTTELDIATTEEIGSDELPLAEPCDLDACELPSCRCASTDIPGEILPRNTPQFVIVTFDDAVNIRNIETYRSVLYNRRNSNNCPAGVTFFVNHEYTDYQRVNELYNNGFEIALHSITHQVPQSYWAEADYDTIKKEIVDQRIQMSHFANIPYDSIQGVRLPFLQMSGNISFQVMADHGLTYDSSWPSIDYISPGLWPYTLDYASVQDCQTPPCPTASIPNTPWVMPMVAWLDLEGLACAMVDSCYHIPDLGDEEGWYRFILTNFERQYMGNRSPFNFFIHEWYLDAYPPVKVAFIRFLNLINNLPDVFMVNAREVVDWMKDPVSVDEYRARPCRTWIPTNCPATGCGPLVSQHNQMSYWMQICNVCPNSYPWIGNPLGQ